MQENFFVNSPEDYDSDESFDATTLNEREKKIIKEFGLLEDPFICNGYMPTAKELKNSKSKTVISISASTRITNFEVLFKYIMKPNIYGLAVVGDNQDYFTYKSFCKALSKQIYIKCLFMESKLNVTGKTRTTSKNDFHKSVPLFFSTLIRMANLRYIFFDSVTFDRKAVGFLKTFTLTKRGLYLEINRLNCIDDSYICLCDMDLSSFSWLSIFVDKTPEVFSLLLGQKILNHEKVVRELPFGLNATLSIKDTGNKYFYGVLCKVSNTCISRDSKPFRGINICFPKMYSVRGEMHVVAKVIGI